ncbi:MAG: HAD family hydrolase [Planctomycetota bacterium]
MPIRAILLDIDGTVAARDGAISSVLMSTLARARDRGVTIACATARTHVSARVRLGTLAWVANEGVFHNGSVVVTNSAVTSAFAMPAATVAKAVTAARTVSSDVMISIHHAHRAPAFSAELTAELLAHWGCAAADLRRFDDALAEPSIKLGMWMPSEAPGSITAVWAAVNAAVGHEATVFRADADRFVFLTASGVNKGSGGQAWFTARNLDPARTIAVGDDITDAPLLSLCGHGIAITDGHPAALAAADSHVAAPPSDALAHALEQLLNNA